MKSRMSEFAGIDGVGSGRRTQSCIVEPVALPGVIVVIGVTAVGLGCGGAMEIGGGVGVGAADGMGVEAGSGVRAGVGFLFEAIDSLDPPGEKTTL
jgi:hypothetical protein